MAYYKLVGKDYRNLWNCMGDRVFPDVRYRVGDVAAAARAGDMRWQSDTVIHFCKGAWNANEWIGVWRDNYYGDEYRDRLYGIRFVRIRPIGRCYTERHDGRGPRGPEESYAGKIKVISEIGGAEFAKMVAREYPRRGEKYLHLEWLPAIPRGLFGNEKFGVIYAGGALAIDPGAFRGCRADGLMLTEGYWSRLAGIERLVPGQLAGLSANWICLPKNTSICPGAFDGAKIGSLSGQLHGNISVADANRFGFDAKTVRVDPEPTMMSDHYRFCASMMR